MTEQFLFEGFQPASAATDRLLFLIYPDSDTAERIAARTSELSRTNRLRGRPVAPERLHITLHHLGEHVGVPRDMIALAHEAAASLTFRPFDVMFDRVASFGGKPGNLPFVLRGGDGLAALPLFHQALGAAMGKTGNRLGKRAEPNFTPHVTLLYDGQSVAEQAIEPIGWTVREFVLVHSLIGQTKHIVLGRWPLKG
jgi:2'-5' RNA ligase